MSKPKKIIITITLIILAVFIILALLWYLSRKSAEKNGNQPMSFRKFLGFESKVQPPANYPTGEYGSDFTSDQNSNSNNSSSDNADKNQTPINANSSTNSSNFTNSFSSPTGVGNNPGNSSNNSDSGSGSSSGSDLNNNGSNNSNNNGGANDQNPINLPGSQELVCSEADVNITFTPEELAKLQELQNRFYAVAQGLYNDSDVAAQIANYDTFKLKQTHINELLNYCQNAAPKITNPIYQRKVPTPFWYEPADVHFNDVYQNQITQQLGSLQNQLDALPNTDTNAAARQDLINQINDLSQDNPTTSVPLGYFGIGFPGQIGGLIKTPNDPSHSYPDEGPRNGYRSIEQVLRLNLW